MWCPLIYDKYAGDHHFGNKITKDVTNNELEDGSYTLTHGIEAINLYNSTFKGTNEIPTNLLKSPMYSVNLYSKDNNGIKTVYTVININQKILENVIKNKKEIDQVDFLKYLCIFHNKYIEFNISESSTYYQDPTTTNKSYNNIQFITEKAMTAVDYTFHRRLDNQDDITTELYEYQQCSINWMLETERNRETIRYNMNEEVIIGNVYFDMHSQAFNLLENRKSITFNGGGLIDEVGLGKTIQIITLSIKNPCVDTSYTRDNDKAHMYSRGTLVTCPNQLCKQWEREILKMVSKDYNPIVITFLTKRHFDKYTYQDVLDADFVIISNTFLDNQAFTLPWTQQISIQKSFSKSNWTKDNHIQVANLFTKMGTEIVNSPIETLSKTQPFFQLIHWNRIVVDEFHEIHKARSIYNHMANLLPYLRSTYRWVVTATPFIDKDNSLYNTFNFLVDYKNTEDKHIMTNSKIVDHLSTRCFRRNTKKSVAEEHTIPPIKDEIKWLKFTSTERMMYNAYLANPNNLKFSVYLRQLCCHPQLADETKLALSNCKTLADIEKMMVSHYKTDMNMASKKVKKIERRIRKVNKKIRKLKKRQLKRMKKKLKRHTKSKGKHVGTDSDDDDSDESDDSDDSDLDVESEDFLADGNDSEEEEEEEDFTEEDALLDYDIKDLLRKGMNLDAVITMETLKDALLKLDDRLKVAKQELYGKTTTFNFFNNMVDRLRNTTTKDTGGSAKKAEKKIKISATTVEDLFNLSDSDSESGEENNDDETCGICLDSISEDDVGVTKCGHIFCYECLKVVINKYHNCPYCKMKLTEKEIYVVSYERKKKKLNPDEKKRDDFINEVGTKMANLIFYLRENNEHTILFSQWDDLLRRVGRILADNGIKNVFCKGNCYQRDKAIREFNDDDKIKAILLSSDSAASGTNLTKASQVILLDPMFGNSENDYKYRKDQEAQAVGRAHRLGQKKSIKVVRLIIKDSVEEEIHWMNVTEDKKRLDARMALEASNAT
jgi:SNF2 family DNA or RNA helicase